MVEDPFATAPERLPVLAGDVAAICIAPGDPFGEPDATGTLAVVVSRAPDALRLSFAGGFEAEVDDTAERDLRLLPAILVETRPEGLLPRARLALDWRPADATTRLPRER